ncbi:hypothetical protein ACFL1V_00595 [Pseudomonadota bacterium]
MKFSAISVLFTALVFIHSTATAGKGPKGGPSFPDYEWTEIVETNFLDPDRWEPRAGLQAVELHNHLFVIAGRTPLPPMPPDFNPFASLIHGDVWVSSDLGSSWVEILEDAEGAGLWKNRAYFEAVTKGNYIYIMGGQNFTTAIPGPPPDFQPIIVPSEFFKDVWRSTDGFDWELMTDDAEWATVSENDPEKCPVFPGVSQGRAGLSAVNFKGKLWVLGGSQGDDNSIGGGEDCRELFNDVWYSEDGSQWHLATDNAPWEARAGGVALVKGGWLYYMGGEKGFVAETDYFNDVWRTRDGANWEEVTGLNGAGWSPRPGHKCSVLANHFVCMGGFGTPTNPSDIWVSKDGADWNQVSSTPWNNDPSSSIFFCNPQPGLLCDNIRYDFDMLTVKGGKGGMKPSIFTFGGDREVFFFVEGEPNFLRVENDVWRYSPQE